MKITLCGSTRFVDAFSDFNAGLTLAGHTVYALAMHGRQAADVDKPADLQEITDDEKIVLDLAHLAKIEESDAVVVLNIDDYVGFSTQREVLWARMRGKKVFWLEDFELHDPDDWPVFNGLRTAGNAELMTSPGARFFKKYTKRETT